MLTNFPAILVMCLAERASAAEFLEVYDGVVPEYSEMVDELCSGSVVALEVRLKPQVLADRGNTDRQEEVVDKFRAACGPWDVNMGELFRWLKLPNTKTSNICLSYFISYSQRATP